MRLLPVALCLAVSLAGGVLADSFVGKRAKVTVQLIEREAASERIDGRKLLSVVRASAVAEGAVMAPEVSSSKGYGLEGLTQRFTSPDGRSGTLDVLVSTSATTRQKTFLTMKIALERPRALSPQDVAFIDAVLGHAVRRFPAFQIKRIKK
ncbi:hypothetical protein [uncultured Tateyamaria sp.]|uniref:hypothetical protein n=1 Tax=uncultured Tateyamaria sp. TaxID=455651 RepID=UPI0026320976|nr:hypothetical protein [uncultured Tateyamaria sp.]